MPWYGLYVYGLIIATGAVLVHSCRELVDPRPGLGRIATSIGALLLVSSHVILAVGVTWTTVSISAQGTALVAFVAHVASCPANGRRVSRLRALIYGLLLVAGFMLREAAIAAMGVALLPLVVWVGVGFLRGRYLPRPAALVAFLAPLVLVIAVQGRIRQTAKQRERGVQRSKRGRIERRRGVLVARYARAGVPRARRLDRRRISATFTTWLMTDDTEFTLEKK